MTNVGLDYISLGRTMTTLSGGESQRISSPHSSVPGWWA